MTMEHFIIALSGATLLVAAYIAGHVRGYAEGAAATAASVIDQEPYGMGELPRHRATMAD